jgi:hypothetical protein
MIAYYPLEPDVPPPPPPSPTPLAKPIETAVKFFEGETTECNYLVLMFVVGVLFIAFTDSMKRS